MTSIDISTKGIAATRVEVSEQEREFEMEADEHYSSWRDRAISTEDDARITAEEDAKSEVQVLTEALQTLSQAHLRLCGRVRKLEGRSIRVEYTDNLEAETKIIPRVAANPESNT